MIQRRLSLGTALILTLMGSLSVLADVEFSTEIQREAKEASLEVTDGRIELTLEDAVSIALNRNLGLMVERFDRSVSKKGIERAEGIYDLNLRGNLSTSDDTSPAASNLDGASITTRETTVLNLGADQLISWGGTASVDFSNVRSESNSSFSLLNPSYSLGLDFTFSQPLLRGFGKDITDRGIKVARLDSGIALERTEQQIISTVASVHRAYWSLVNANAQLGVAEESLDLAKELHDINKVRVEVGTLAPLELVQSEAGIASRQEGIIQAQGAIGDAADELRQLLNLDGIFWDTEILPLTSPEEVPLKLSLNAAVESALKNRPELRIQRRQTEKLEVDSAFYRNQRKPRLNLEVKYGLNGLGGDIETVCDTSAVQLGLCGIEQLGDTLVSAPGGYGDALDQVGNADFDQWSIALNFGLPLQNREARAASTIADLSLEKGEFAERELEQSIMVEVRKANRAVETASKQIASAKASRVLAERNLDAERKRYENGLSTSFQILEIQEDLTSAKSREVNAVISHRNASISFYQSIGGVLDVLGIEITDQ